MLPVNSMNKKKITVVIPTIRNLDFLESWGDEFRDCIGIIVEDHAQKEIQTPTKYFKKVYHYNWTDVDKELGNDSWIIPRINAGIRSYGFLKSYQLGADITLTLDDDCYPIKGQEFLKQHLENLSLSAPEDWFPTYPHRKYCYTRGFPYGVRNKREVVISHGLWKGVLDLDAPTQLLNLDLKVPVSFDFLEFVPIGYFFPMCSMNLAFKTKITPIMYFPLMGESPLGKPWGYDRFDDIWAGIFAKKIVDHLGLAVVNGSPFVMHERASNVFKNLQTEAGGIEVNENFFKKVDRAKLSSSNIKDCYWELAQKTKFPNEKYFDNLRKAMKIWVNLF